MATGLPYFKFTPTEWLTGDIVYEEYDVQGLFINICAIYWQRNGRISLEDIEKRYKKATALGSLIGRFISVKEGFIAIDFLDEQLTERGHISIQNSKNGSLGGRPKQSETLKKKPNANRTQSEPKAKESQEEEEKEVNKKKNKNIIGEEKTSPPSEEVFLSYCKDVLKEKFLPLEFSLKIKYKAWIDSDWIDGNGKKIKNWKTKILNTIPFLKEKSSGEKENKVDQAMRIYNNLTGK